MWSTIWDVVVWIGGVLLGLGVLYGYGRYLELLDEVRVEEDEKRRIREREIRRRVRRRYE